MLKLTTEGIVLKKTDYSESSIIIKLLTENEGVKSFIYPGAKNKKKKGNIIRPMAILSVTYYQRGNSNLLTVSELDTAIVFKDIPFNPYKSGIVFFINEVLYQTVKDQEESKTLYTYLKKALFHLDNTANCVNFPISFLFDLLTYLGFQPEIYPEANYFDLKEGAFVKNLPAHPMYVNKELSTLLLLFAKANTGAFIEPEINLIHRRKLISEMINFYRLNFDQFKDLKSIPVLESLYHG